MDSGGSEGLIIETCTQLERDVQSRFVEAFSYGWRRSLLLQTYNEVNKILAALCRKSFCTILSRK